ncbi:MAG: thymidine phosphorylase [Pyrinomonadaceae bacterium]
MRPQDLIRRKRDGEELSGAEINRFVRGVVSGDVADYQASALLMAIFLRGMTDAEQLALTSEMLRSGRILDFSDIPKLKVDKHSTGGVGDKTSLLIAPMAAAMGLCVPMISGRGLGHTGGTLDKLEAIPGYRVDLALDEFRAILVRVGFAMTGQTAEIAPADRKLYALRDATATVEAIPLIVASILSKKLAAGLNALVLDVKTGSGALMGDERQARALAHALVATANNYGMRTEAVLSDMNQPLGSAVGHAHEVLECIRLLRGEATDLTRPVVDLSVELTARMATLAGAARSLDDARAHARDVLATGAAWECFRRNVEAQGGDARVCDHPERVLALSALEVKVESPRAGFVKHIDAAEIGRTIAAIGGGRVRTDDRIDHAVGFVSRARIGDRLDAAAAVGLLYCRRADDASIAASRIQAAYHIGDEPLPETPALIKDIITA